MKLAGEPSAARAVITTALDHAALAQAVAAGAGMADGDSATASGQLLGSE